MGRVKVGKGWKCCGKSGGVSAGPGLIFIVPCMDEVKILDTRTTSFDVSPQDVLTKDNINVKLDAVVYYKIRKGTEHVRNAVCNVDDYAKRTKLLVSGELRNFLGNKDLAVILKSRASIGEDILTHLNRTTDPLPFKNWGIKVNNLKMLHTNTI